MTRAPAELRLVADRAAKALAAAGVPAAGDGVAVAVSGGADSLALLHALRALAGPRGWRLAVVTVDHGLRPGSAADAAFVADHAKALGLPALVRTLGPADLAPHRQAGPEGAARAARYGALWPAADELGCRWLATGHTLDDQAETVLLQLLRGTGPDGLAGMAVRSGRLLRPLLGARRAETRACCAAIGLAWREDPTNAGDGPLRNRVRQQSAAPAGGAAPGRHPDPGPHRRPGRRRARLARPTWSPRPWPPPWRGEVWRGCGRGVDSQAPPHPPSATLPDGAPTTRGAGTARLDAEALAALPVALARRVVREAARRAGDPVPDAAATDRILGLPAD